MSSHRLSLFIASIALLALALGAAFNSPLQAADRISMPDSYEPQDLIAEDWQPLGVDAWTRTALNGHQQFLATTERGMIALRPVIHERMSYAVELYLRHGDKGFLKVMEHHQATLRKIDALEAKHGSGPGLMSREAAGTSKAAAPPPQCSIDVLVDTGHVGCYNVAYAEGEYIADQAPCLGNCELWTFAFAGRTSCTTGVETYDYDITEITYSAPGGGGHYSNAFHLTTDNESCNNFAEAEWNCSAGGFLYDYTTGSDCGCWAC
ncbi:MAG: hypothetical protein AAGD01_18665 [Acidobacteriota bacterium]